MFFDPDDNFYDSDDYYGGGYSSDDYDNSPRGIRVPRYTYIKDGRVHSGDHAEKFRKCLHEMFLSSNYCDVTLVTNTTTFKAHKVVLAANSAYFNAMFSSTCSEALQSVVSFKDNPFVTSTGMSAILEYAYTGSFTVSQNSVRDILEVARHLLMEDVTKCCEKFIKDITIKQENYVELFETARDFGLKGLEKRIERFLKGNKVNLDNYFDMIDFVIVSKGDAVLKKVVAFISQELHHLMFSKELLDILAPKILLAMVKADRHGILTDMSLIDFIVKWVETSPEDRLPVLSDVIKELNLLCFEVETLDKIANLPFIKEDEAVKEYISEAKSRLLEVKGRSAEDDLYVFTYGRDLTCHSFASESVITKKAVLDRPIQSKRLHRKISMSYGNSVIAVGDILFLIGGPIDLPNGRKRCPCFSFDPARNVWKEHASLPSNREAYGLVASEGEVYVIGGRKDYDATNRVNVYDFTRDEWRTETPLSRPFRSLTAVASNGNIYVYGYDDNGHGGGISNAFLKYDRDKNGWVEKSPPRISPSPYAHLVAWSKGLYQITSNYGTPDVAALGVWFYDQTLDHWECSTLHHTFDQFDIKVALSHIDDMFIIANYRKKSDTDLYGTRVSSLFRFSEASRKIELLKDDFPHEYRNEVALVSIPKASIARLTE